MYFFNLSLLIDMVPVPRQLVGFDLAAGWTVSQEFN